MRLKDIVEFFVICYIFCLLTKIAMNRLIFNPTFLLDALVITSGCTVGYFIGVKLRKNSK